MYAYAFLDNPKAPIKPITSPNTIPAKFTQHRGIFD